MDLREFYLENVSKTEYYFKFYDLIKNINYTYNVFYGLEESQNYKFIIYGIDDAIEKFKNLCQPENEIHSQEDECWFYLILFYLYKNGYIIEEFPRIIEYPPTESYQFVNKDIRNKILAEGKDNNGTVRYAERRKLVANLTFKQKQKYIEINDTIEENFKKISNRQAEFNKMSVDEKILEIANLIENFLKKDKKFIALDYSKICFDYINEDTIKKYRKDIQCFRHSSEQALKERANYSKEQKDFMIDYGLTILKVIHTLLNTEI